MKQPSFFPGNSLLHVGTQILTTLTEAKAIQAQVESDLTTMKSFPFSIWRPVIASRYSADPLVMELLTRFEKLHDKALDDKENQDASKHDINDDRDNETQEWSDIFP